MGKQTFSSQIGACSIVTLDQRKKTMSVYFTIMAAIEFSLYFFARWVFGSHGLVYAGVFIIWWLITVYPIISTNWRDLKFDSRSTFSGITLLVVVAISLFVSIGVHLSTVAFLIFLLSSVAKNWLSSVLIISMIDEELSCE